MEAFKPMNLITRLRTLEARIYAADAHEADKYHVDFLHELGDAWPKLLEVIKQGEGLRAFVEKHLKANSYRTAGDDEHARALMDQWDDALEGDTDEHD